MSESVRRVFLLPQPPEVVWQSLANSAALAEWLYPNSFEPSVGHRFTFEVPPKPEVEFEGMSVHCEVLACEEPSLLVFSWSAGELVGTQVSFRLERHDAGTRVLFEHSGFAMTSPFGRRAFNGAKHGWTRMLEEFIKLVTGDKGKAT